MTHKNPSALFELYCRVIKHMSRTTSSLAVICSSAVCSSLCHSNFSPLWLQMFSCKRANCRFSKSPFRWSNFYFQRMIDILRNILIKHNKCKSGGGCIWTSHKNRIKDKNRGSTLRFFFMLIVSWVINEIFVSRFGETGRFEVSHWCWYFLLNLQKRQDITRFNGSVLMNHCYWTMTGGNMFIMSL